MPSHAMQVSVFPTFEILANAQSIPLLHITEHISRMLLLYFWEILQILHSQHLVFFYGCRCRSFKYLCVDQLKQNEILCFVPWLCWDLKVFAFTKMFLFMTETLDKFTTKVHLKMNILLLLKGFCPDFCPDFWTSWHYLSDFWASWH